MFDYLWALMSNHPYLAIGFIVMVLAGIFLPYKTAIIVIVGIDKDTLRMQPTGNRGAPLGSEFHGKFSMSKYYGDQVYTYRFTLTKQSVDRLRYGAKNNEPLRCLCTKKIGRPWHVINVNLEKEDIET